MIGPADANETAAAWTVALERTTGADGPAPQSTGAAGAEGSAQCRRRRCCPRGLHPDPMQRVGAPAVVVIATGGEVTLALDAPGSWPAAESRRGSCRCPRGSSLPNNLKTTAGRVLPPSIPRLAVEAGVTLGWRDIVGDTGAVIGIDRFGASAPGAEVAQHLGLTVEAVVKKAIELVGDEVTDSSR